MKPLILNLKHVYYERVKSGEDREHLRKYNGKYNEATCKPGRQVIMHDESQNKDILVGQIYKFRRQRGELFGSGYKARILDLYGTLNIDIACISLTDMKAVNPSYPMASRHPANYKLISRSSDIMDNRSYPSQLSALLRIPLNAEIPEGFQEVKEINGVDVRGTDGLLLSRFRMLRRYSDTYDSQRVKKGSNIKDSILFNIGFTGSYIHDYKDKYICDIPGEFAVAWAKSACPDSNCAGNVKFSELETGKLRWLNKLFVVVAHGNNTSICLYKHDGTFSIRELDYKL